MDVTLKTPTESDGYASQDISVRQSSDNTTIESSQTQFDGSISSENHSSGEPVILAGKLANSLLSEPGIIDGSEELLTVEELEITPRKETTPKILSPTGEQISLEQFLNETRTGSPHSSANNSTNGSISRLSGQISPDLNRSQQSLRYSGPDFNGSIR